MLMPDQLQPVSVAVTIDLLWLGFVGFIMQIVITTAYRYADAVVVASMRYLQMPMSGIVGYWLFAEVLAASEIIGAVIIIGSCLVIAWREVVRSRQVSHPGV
jgi:drug/metabolite transporter (DMT)-like permease